MAPQSLEICLVMQQGFLHVDTAFEVCSVHCGVIKCDSISSLLLSNMLPAASGAIVTSFMTMPREITVERCARQPFAWERVLSGCVADAHLPCVPLAT